ncbi:hypothetical protein ACFL2Q_10190 [Thermodesulfobacteriota bacterium]
MEKEDESMDGFIRPEPEILHESALVPEGNFISPPPNQFTHEVIRTLPYYYASMREDKSPDGQLPAGRRVVLLVYEGGTHCRVVDEKGLYVEIEYGGLTKL